MRMALLWAPCIVVASAALRLAFCLGNKKRKSFLREPLGAPYAPSASAAFHSLTS